MKVVFWCLVFTVAMVKISSKLLFKNETDVFSKNFQLGNAILKLTKNSYFNKTCIVQIINAIIHSEDNVIQGMLKSFVEVSFSVQIEDFINLKTSKRSVKLAMAVIIFVDSTESVKIFQSLLQPESFSHQGFITIVAIKHFKTDEISNIFELFWKTLVINVNLITPSVNGTLELFTFIPYNNLKCGDTMPVKINIFTNYSWQTEKFHSEKIRNLNKCRINVAAAVVSAEPYVIEASETNRNHEIVGIERDMFEVFAKALNFELKIQNFGKLTGIIFENGSATGKNSYLT